MIIVAELLWGSDWYVEMVVKFCVVTTVISCVDDSLKVNVPRLSYIPPIRMLSGLHKLFVSVIPLTPFASQVAPASFENGHSDGFADLAQSFPWVHDTPLVVKPDQLIKRRGKAGLIAINTSWEEVKAWITDHFGKDKVVEGVSGILDTFIVEPFVPHKQEEEYYLCIISSRSEDEILFYHEGGVDVGDVDAKAVRHHIPVGEKTSIEKIEKDLLQLVPVEKRSALAAFILSTFNVFSHLNFVYMEINPLVVQTSSVGGGDVVISPLDMAAKLDETASFLCQSKWGDVTFPAPFGRAMFPEETYITKLDSSTGASLKLTILNHNGRVWTLVAGGGASVVYADTISDLGFGKELANYGEYSGAPTENQTYEYARTVISLMIKAKNPEGKVLIVAGGIANFTDVAGTFTGIISALRQYADDLREHNVTIWVRRGGPNHQEGLRLMKACGESINLPVHVFGPETHITAIVPMALGLKDAISEYDAKSEAPRTVSKDPSNRSLLSGVESWDASSPPRTQLLKSPPPPLNRKSSTTHVKQDFNRHTTAIVYGLQQRAVQGMLDFDFMCKRTKSSVACLVFPFSGNHFLKFYWGMDETLIPVYTSLVEAVRKHPDASLLVNFSSFRSVYETTMDALRLPSLKTIAIIAEGVPESQSRLIIKEASEKGVGLIGPATVGGIKPGCMRIGNTGGMLDNIVMSKLYRCGSVAYVSKSGGMSNELNNIISRNADGVYEGVAIGGDRYPGSRFIDHLLRYQDDENVHIMLLLGEVGGIDEYAVCEALKDGRLTKPLIAWCIGTCASIFPFEVQFGHAGACARGGSETAKEKNAALQRAGAFVPPSFDGLPGLIKKIYDELVIDGHIEPKVEPPVPTIPMDYTWARRLGLVRKPANFISTISDDRGEELSYAGMPISDVINENVGLGGVLSCLWFRRRLPDYATKFIEMILVITADHGPAVSAAHNTIVTTRAGKDLVSALCSGLLTIGPRFGGAIDKAAEMFTEGYDTNTSPLDFVTGMRKKKQLIMGIGHRLKSKTNPDMRVSILKDYVFKHFKDHSVLDYALEVETVTLQKKDTLILNVDGAIGASFVDMLRSCGTFNREEADDLISNGVLNGLFVLGRSIGLIGHFVDQKRLKQPLYRHPTEDISYATSLTL